MDRVEDALIRRVTGQEPTVPETGGRPRVTRDGRELPCEWAEMMAHDLAEDALEIADAPVPLIKGRMDPGAL